MSGPRTAILLMAYGAAASPEEIPAYLQDIRGGRPPDARLIEEIRRRYQKMGGKSPLLEITRAQAAALEARLNEKAGDGAAGGRFKVFIGMRHSEPSIQEAVGRIQKDGFAAIAAMPLTPYQSKMSTDAYMKKFDEALLSAARPPEIVRIFSWSDHPGFIEACATILRRTLDTFPQKQRFELRVVFAAHSLPQRILQDGDPYPAKLKETVEAVARRVGLDRWEFAYQSRGATAEPWLGPDVAEVIDRLAAQGCKDVVLDPIGFVSDHMETLYDDDVLYRELALSKNMRFERVPSLNADPLFIDALADIVLERVSRTVG